MHFDQKPYDQSEVDSIKRMLEAEAAEGKPLYFEVKVDDRVVIHATLKPERFDQLYTFINEKTRRLVISVFQNPAGGARDYHTYLLNGTPADTGMNGLPDMERLLSEKMQMYKDQTAAERVKEKLRETEEKLQQAEDYIDLLSGQIEELKAKPNHVGGWDIGKLAGSAVREIALHYPKVLENVPVLNGIAKVIQEDRRAQPKATDESPGGEMSFRPKGQDNASSAEAGEQQEAVRVLGEFIAEHFDQTQKQILGWVIEALGESPDQLTSVAELLNINVQQRLREEE